MISRISKMMRNGEDADADVIEDTVVVTEDADGAEETLRTMSLRRNGEDADAETLRTMSLKRRKSAADVDADADAESLKVTRPMSLKSLTVPMISRISKMMRNGEDADADVIEDTVVVTEDETDELEELNGTDDLEDLEDDEEWRRRR